MRTKDDTACTVLTPCGTMFSLPARCCLRDDASGRSTCMYIYSVGYQHNQLVICFEGSGELMGSIACLVPRTFFSFYFASLYNPLSTPIPFGFPHMWLFKRPCLARSSIPVVNHFSFQKSLLLRLTLCIIFCLGLWWLGVCRCRNSLSLPQRLTKLTVSFPTNVEVDQF